ncbi:hypothetical protein L6164_017224 [Bauhinia variegata]|uniref:Uncharacterized protein n=1 Tax=Bauhinia variegata TaxID=167791 RepID=A0ACB9N7E0_BAUVA|nr:hypothetical protein L6164_017224 [Bauhinia variegata]
MERGSGSSSSKSPVKIEERKVNAMENLDNIMEPKISALVVEDDNITRLMHRKILERLNMEAKAVANGKAAVDLYHAGSYFDVIFMDKEMPIMDGAQATQELRAMGVKSMIVGVTSLADVSERNKFMASDGIYTRPEKMQFEITYVLTLLGSSASSKFIKNFQDSSKFYRSNIRILQLSSVLVSAALNLS